MVGYSLGQARSIELLGRVACLLCLLVVAFPVQESQAFGQRKERKNIESYPDSSSIEAPSPGEPGLHGGDSWRASRRAWGFDEVAKPSAKNCVRDTVIATGANVSQGTMNEDAYWFAGDDKNAESDFFCLKKAASRSPLLRRYEAGISKDIHVKPLRLPGGKFVLVGAKGDVHCLTPEFSTKGSASGCPDSYVVESTQIKNFRGQPDRFTRQAPLAMGKNRALLVSDSGYVTALSANGCFVDQSCGIFQANSSQAGKKRGSFVLKPTFVNSSGEIFHPLQPGAGVMTSCASDDCYNFLYRGDSRSGYANAAGDALAGTYVLRMSCGEESTNPQYAKALGSATSAKDYTSFPVGPSMPGGVDSCSEVALGRAGTQLHRFEMSTKKILPPQKEHANPSTFLMEVGSRACAQPICLKESGQVTAVLCSIQGESNRETRMIQLMNVGYVHEKGSGGITMSTRFDKVKPSVAVAKMFPGGSHVAVGTNNGFVYVLPTGSGVESQTPKPIDVGAGTSVKNIEFPSSDRMLVQTNNELQFYNCK